MKSKVDIISELKELHNNLMEHYGQMNLVEMNIKYDKTWTPAQFLDFINRCNRYSAKLFNTSKWMLRLRFGKPAATPINGNMPEKSLGLPGSSHAWVPSKNLYFNDELYVEANASFNELMGHIHQWDEKDFDRYNMTHPIMGTFTVRGYLCALIAQLKHISPSSFSQTLQVRNKLP